MISPLPVRLLVGKHVGPNKGYGVAHIWAEHRDEMARFGLFEQHHVGDFVSSVVRPHCPLYFDIQRARLTRLLAVRSKNGTAILELREAATDNYWSVVTAFMRPNPRGTKVGILLAQ
jgi:hypothetical protein